MDLEESRGYLRDSFGHCCAGLKKIKKNHRQGSYLGRFKYVLYQ
jgi:hypothetical protein